ncbi:MAG: ribonuclease III domain-containing protein [Eubacteriales bacterium]|nr:ribonuclease III domain-containing protein [Eubacteriales bacterium]
MMDQEIQNINSTTLAYMGDAVYEVRVREMLIEQDPHDVNKLHKMAVRYVSAAGQAKAMKKLAEGFLTEEEVRLYKRARNHRSMSRPRNTDPRIYKIATGFEALLGYLFLAEESERLDEVIEEAIRIIEEE